VTYDQPMATTALPGEEDSYLGQLDSVDFQPIFIIGPHRSGTTILQHVLGQTGCFNVTTAYHVLYRNHLLKLHFAGRERDAREELSRLFASKGLQAEEHHGLPGRAQREGHHDSVPISPEVSEEYCWALDQSRRIVVGPKNLKSFTDFCKKVQLIQVRSRPLLLKNPYDTLNFLYLHEAFPRARFVVIHRNPLEVVNSQVRLMRAMLRKKSEYYAMIIDRYRWLCEHPIPMKVVGTLFSERLPFLAWQVSHHVSRNFDYVLENLDKLGDTAISVTYPELCREPGQTMRRILDFLKLREETPQDYSRLLRSREPSYAPDVEKWRVWLEKRNQAYCRRFGV
jgi:hypothetical protein